MTEMHYWSATETLRRFRAKEVSPVEVLDAVASRITAVNGEINAFSEQMIDDARVQAKAAEARYLAGEPAGPLDGLPVAVKDEHQIAGRSATSGSLLLDGVVAEQTHPVVERLVGAGGIIHGRTTTPEFSVVPFTHTAQWGVTRNPWNLDYSPGGSSGGSGAALAAGMAMLATGSDIGGSIRIPASFCGVVGFKPPFGRVPALPPYNQHTYCADGPLGRTVADVALFQNVLAGPHPHDHASLRPTYVLPERLDGVAGLRVALCLELGNFAVDSAIVDATLNAGRLLEAAGASVEQVTLPWTFDTIEPIALAQIGRLAVEDLSGLPAEQRQHLMPYTLDFARRSGEALARLSTSEILATEAALYRPLGELLERFDVLLCPTWANQGLPAGDELIETPLPLNDTTTTWEQAIMTMPFNVMSRVPVLSVPSGIAPTGVPTGVQIVGRTYDDVTPFRVGAALEAAQELWPNPAWRPAI